MKTIYKKISVFLLAVIVISCKQDVITLQAPVIVAPPVVTPTKGTADFTKFVAIGNSLTSGFQAGALFTEGQNNSLPKLMATQFALVGGGDFNQPTINSEKGYYGVGPGGVILGRLLLQGTPPAPSPSVSTPESAPTNPAFIFDPTKRAALNNFGVPGVKLIEAVGVSNYGTLNPYYGRFASDAANKTLLVDAAEKAGTFFLLFLGNNDVLKYATRGAIDNPDNIGVNDMTPVSNFGPAFSAALTAMMGASAKGVVGNIPNVTTIPFFTTIPWNTITLDAANSSALTTQLANNYNGFLDAMTAASVITATERDIRKLAFVTGKNGVLVTDETLTDLTAAMVGNSASALVPFAKARQLKSTDLLCLTSGGYLGKPIDITGDGTPDGVNGVSIPLANSTNVGTLSLKGDDLYLSSTEIGIISQRVTAFNSAISNAVTTANTASTRVALADINGTLTALVTARVGVYNGVTITPNFAPPTGAFSEDGVHPNSRGYAFIANIFLDAINKNFSATIPLVDISKYKGTGLPVNP
jgi:hypothetical protein